MATNQVQRRHLRARVEKAQQNKANALWARKDTPPANVRRAYARIAELQKITKVYERQRREAQHNERARIHADANAVMEKVLFCEPQEALAAVIKFESSVK